VTKARDVTIYHNPKCSTSRNVLALIRAQGVEPKVVDYLKTPLSRADLEALMKRGKLQARDLLRAKEPLAAELGLKDASASDRKILDAIAANPVLLNRPIVATPKGARPCRPPETVLDLL
jgi:arsenate reductase